MSTSVMSNFIGPSVYNNHQLTKRPKSFWVWGKPPYFGKHNSFYCKHLH